MNEREIEYIVVNERYVKTSVGNEGERVFSVLNSMENTEAFITQVVGELHPDAGDQRVASRLGHLRLLRSVRSVRPNAQSTKKNYC